HPKIADYIATHPQYHNWTYFDGLRWYVSYYDSNLPDDWAEVTIRDQDATIVQIYVIQGKEVYLDWPTAQLDADRVIELINGDDIAGEYLATTNTSLFSTWIWFDGFDTWYANYGYFYVFDELAGDTSASYGDELGFTDPSGGVADQAGQAERLMNPDYTPYWMEIQVSDSENRISQITSNFDESSFLVHNMTEAMDAARSSTDYLSFTDGADFVYSWISIRWDYQNGDPVAKWDFSAYGWERQVISSFPQFETLDFWFSKYLDLVLMDTDLSVSEADRSAEPNRNPEDVLSDFLTNQTVDGFVEKYGEIYGYISFDPFSLGWWISIFPTWTYGAYIMASLDTQGTIETFYINEIPDELFPTMTVEEVRTLTKSIEAYTDFVETYEVYGNITTGIYYSYQYEERNWIAYAWSEVISEAYLNLRIDDLTGDVVEVSRYDPKVPPTHNTSEILAYVEQLPEVQAFLEEVDSPRVWISYYSNYESENQTGTWYISYSARDFSQQISLQIDDVTLEVISIYRYP
ncbi:MAG: hypothetical protein D6732_10090, partial [Methanobacteriota archaeon]